MRSPAAVPVLPLVVLLLTGCATAHRAPPVTEARRLLARDLAERGDAKGALPLADALCRERPRDADAFVLRGTIYRDLGLLEEAERDLRQALAIDRRGARAHSELAVVLDRRRLHEDAAPHHARAVELSPDDPRLMNNLGFSLFTRGHAREAIDVYLRAVRLAPSDPRLRNNLAFAYAVTGDFTRAAQSFAMGGSAAQAMNNLGWAYENKGLLAQAFEMYLEAARLDPALAAARTNLLAVAVDLGRPVPADLLEPRPPVGPEVAP
jgi:Flp pilus assembly protein TadD